MRSGYYMERDDSYRERSRTIIDSELPFFAKEYFVAVSISLSASTVYHYARRLYAFFAWVSEHMNEVDDVRHLCMEHISLVRSEDIELYLTECLPGRSDKTKNAHISAISAFYRFFEKRGKLSCNPIDGILRPKNKRSPKIYLDANDKSRFSDTLMSGTGLSERALKYNDKIGSKSRDIAMLAILMDTGVRVSELVGIDLAEIDFERCRFPVRRKGGNIDIVYFSDETADLIQDYVSGIRAKVCDKSESALFVSMVGSNKGGRISVRSVELIVKKYAVASGVANASKMSPHKLRHTCAMALLKETGNIALVQKQLGHESIVSTTVYASADDTDLMQARNLVSSGIKTENNKHDESSTN